MRHLSRFVVGVVFALTLIPGALGRTGALRQFISARNVTAPDQNRYLSPVVFVADFNMDGRPDILTADINSTTLILLTQQPNGTFAPQNVPSSLYGNGYFGDIAVADVNGDGRPDVITLLAAYNQGDPVGDVILRAYLGNGDGTFRAPTEVRVSSPTNPGTLLIRDFNDDKKPDVLLSLYDKNGNTTLFAFKNQGDGTFTGGKTGAVLHNYTDLLDAGDVNGDGKTDLLVTAANSAGPIGFQVLMGNGRGSFTPGPVTRISLYSAAFADVNRDGHADVIATREQTTSILLGNGDGTFRSSAIVSNVASHPVSSLVPATISMAMVC